MKKSAQEDVFKSAGTLVQEALTGNSDENFLPKPANLERVANRHRQKFRPKHPTDLTFAIQYDYVPENFLQRDIIVNEGGTCCLLHRIRYIYSRRPRGGT